MAIGLVPVSHIHMHIHMHIRKPIDKHIHARRARGDETVAAAAIAAAIDAAVKREGAPYIK